VLVQSIYSQSKRCNEILKANEGNEHLVYSSWPT